MAKRMKALFMAFVMVFSTFVVAVPSFAADANVTYTVDKTEAAVGDTITVVISNKEMSVATFTSGVAFDTEKLECTSIKGARTGTAAVEALIFLKDSILGDWVRMASSSTIAEANNTGKVGFGYTATEDAGYQALAFATIQFVVKEGATGTTDVVLYEKTDSATTPVINEAVAKTTITIKGDTPAVPTPEETPNATFAATGANTGTLSGVTAGMQYSVDGGNTWVAINGDSVDLTGVTAENDVKVKKAGNGTTTTDSAIQTIDVTKAATPTGVDTVACTTAANDDGKITGVGIAMEYSIDGENWTEITGETVTKLAAGTYKVRVKATATALASDAVTVTVAAHTCDYTELEYNATHHWYECTCGDKDASRPAEEHKGGTATCKAAAVCEVCKQAYGDVDANNHVEGTKCVDNNDGKTHKVVYECCPDVVVDANVPHDYKNNGKCECGAEEPVTLEGIAVTTAPAKTNYTAGESFDPAGMVVTATYSDGSTEAVTGYTVTPSGALTVNDKVVTITYEGKTTTLAITVNEPAPTKYGVVVTNGTGDGNFAAGETVTITANAAAEGKEFDKWVVVAGEVVLADATATETTFTMPAGRVEVEATYKDKVVVPTEFAVVVTNGTGSGNYAAGETVTITANAAAEGKEFDKWVVVSGGVELADATATETTFTMPAGRVEVEATYKDKVVVPTEFAVVVTNGTGSGNYAAGATVTITADAAAEGKEFDKWVVVAGEVVLADAAATETTFTMPAGRVEVEATYKDKVVVPTEFAVVVTNGTGSGNYAAGATVTITADAAAEGKEFDKWVVVAGEVVLADATATTTTFTMPAGRVEVEATYKDKVVVPTEYTITATAGANGTITPSGAVKVEEGKNQTFAIAAEAGYHIKDVKVNGQSVGAVSTYTFEKVAADATIAVEFEQNSGETPAETTVKLDPTSANLKVGETTTLTATVTPEGTVADVTWTSSDESVATVTANGVVTAVKAGTATITATAKTAAGETVTATCVITVTDNTGSGTGSSSSNGGSSRYKIVVEDTDNGEVDANRTKAKAGTKVTITATPDEGYEVGEVVVKTSKGKEIKVTDNGDGEFTFKMPSSKVYVEVEFDKVKDADVEEPAQGDEEVEVIILTIDSVIAWVFDEYVANDVAPVIRNGRTMLPARFVAEALGGTVGWDEAEQKVTIVKDATTLEIFIGEPFAVVNGEPVQLDSPAFIENSRTYLPIRFIAENLGATVAWDAVAQTVTITPGK